MRNLTGHDVFMALKLLQKIGVKDELVSFANYINQQVQGKGPVTEENQQKLGAKLIFGLLSNCGTDEAESAFFAFLAGPLEEDAETLKNTDLLDLIEKVQTYLDTMMNRERWNSFFRSLSGAIKSTI